jgi:hypothetical protein
LTEGQSFRRSRGDVALGQTEEFFVQDFAVWKEDLHLGSGQQSHLGEKFIDLGGGGPLTQTQGVKFRISRPTS